MKIDNAEKADLMYKEDFRLKQVCIRIQEMGATICGLTE